MILTPRYDGPTILTIGGTPGDRLAPFARQRRRMMAMLDAFTNEQWQHPTRCAGWTTRDVVAHLVTVNTFWHASITGALAGAPTRMLAGFDPAATPPVLVGWLDALDTPSVHQQFVATSETLLDATATLDDAGWNTLAEAPAGMIPIRLLIQHALWDCWTHERDIAIPLGITPAVEPDELRACLQFAAAISPALGLGLGRSTPAVVGVAATDPDIEFVLDVGTEVAIRNEPADGAPCLRGDALELVEALTLRAPMPAATPPEWTAMLNGLSAAFDALPL